MSMITAALGVYAVLGINRAGVLVAKTFDESLMSINYARAAAADFASMQAAFARRWIASDSEMRAQLDDKVDTWGQSLADDLGHRGTTLAVHARSPRRRQCPAGGQELERHALAADRRHRTGRQLGHAGPLFGDRGHSRSTCWSITPPVTHSSIARRPARPFPGRCISISSLRARIDLFSRGGLAAWRGVSSGRWLRRRSGCTDRWWQARRRDSSRKRR